MTEMTFVERLETAIEKLEGVRRLTTPGPWRVRSTPGDVLVRGAENAEVFRGNRNLDGSLVVMLHRTIDAQLTILRAAHEELRPTDPTTTAPPDRQTALAVARAIALANAINGPEDPTHD